MSRPDACVAFLRGINLGPNRRLAMADLRKILTGLGHGSVRTHLSSGNAVFLSDSTPARIEAEIQAAIKAELGMDLAVMVRGSAEMAAAVRGNPLLPIATDPSRLLAHFLSAAPDPALLAANDPSSLDPDRIRIGRRVIYQWCPDGFLAAPPVSGFVEKKLGVMASTRNWNTVTRVADLCRQLTLIPQQ